MYVVENKMQAPKKWNVAIIKNEDAVGDDTVKGENRKRQEGYCVA